MGNFDREKVLRAAKDPFGILAQTMPADKYNDLIWWLENAPDEVLEKFIQGGIDAAKEKPLRNAKDHFSLIEEGRKLFGTTKSAAEEMMSDTPLQILETEKTEKIWRDACRTKPSDHVLLMGKDDNALCDLWKSTCSDEFKITGVIPSDIFFAGTVPLLDCQITVDERDVDPEKGNICDYRVVIFPDYKERINADHENPVCVGTVVFQEGALKMIIPINVVCGINKIVFIGVGFINVSEDFYSEVANKLSMQFIGNLAYALLTTWYGIQIALLHPTVKNVFQSPQKEKVVVDGKMKGKKKNKRVTRYMKRFVVKALDIERFLYGGDKSYNRRALVWYVIGHWRHYSDGKKVFVQPYWKGALRDIKKNLDDRDRLIDTTPRSITEAFGLG